jgi:hypothetical protein
MSMPGFTAEASIYRTCARYYGDPMSELRRGEEGMIHPALPIRTFCVPSQCYALNLCCMVWNGGHYCWYVTGDPIVGLPSAREGGQS